MRACGIVACLSEVLRSSTSYHQGADCSLGGPIADGGVVHFQACCTD